MLGKLTIRNAKRSIKDYLIYFITTTLSFSLIFSFYLVVFADDIMTLSSDMENFRLAILFVSGIILFVIAWLINYTMRFLFLKRSKEFGMFSLLGIPKKKIIRVFLLENICLGLISLFFSFFIGFFISQFFVAIIMNIFALPYEVMFQISWEAILLTFLYFGIIYLFVLFRSYRRMRKLKVYDLLYLDKQNETKMFRNKKTHTFYFLVSFFIGIIGLFLFYSQFRDLEHGNFILILVSIILMVISIYGVTITLMQFIQNFILKRENIKYKKNHLILTRNVSSKTKSIGFTLGTLSFLVLLTFISVTVSNIFKGAFEEQTKTSAPYDIMIYDKESSKFPEYLKVVEENYTIEEMIEYSVYTDNLGQIRNRVSDGMYGYQEFDAYLRLSDYNKLLQMRGEAPITLEDDEFYLHSYRDVSSELNQIITDDFRIQLNGKNYRMKAHNEKGYSTAWSRGSSYIIVVPDELVENMTIVNTLLSINTKEETSENFENLLIDKIEPAVYQEVDEDGHVIAYVMRSVTVKGSVLAENRSFITICSFTLMFVAFIFTSVVGTILAIQSLNDSEKFKHHYKILSNLGLTQREINGIIKKQLGLLFFVPIIYPFLMNIVISFSLNQLFNPLLASDYSIYIYFFGGTFLFLFVYSIYFIATYFGYKINVFAK